MFLHLCLLAAGLHIGRNLLKDLRGSSADGEGGAKAGPAPALTRAAGADSAPQVELAGEGDGEEKPPPSAPASALALSLVRDPRAEKKAGVEEQFNVALASLGLSSAGLFFPHLRGLRALRALSGALVLYGYIPIFARAKELLFEERRVGAAVLDSISVVASLAAKDYIIGSLQFLFSATGQRLQLMTERETEESLIHAFERRSERAWAVKDGVEVSVLLTSLRKGDVIVVDAGSPIPVDGIITKGAGLVDQQLLTGESQPHEKGVGDKVFATSVVLSGRLCVQVETTGKATAAAEIAEALRNTSAVTSTLEGHGQVIADDAARTTLALSAVSLPLFGSSIASALLSATFLDNMRFFIPLSMLTELRAAYAAGIFIKDGRSLELLPRVDTIIFDKTGTLTLSDLRVFAVHPAARASEDEVLALAAAAEHRQTHPIARAILAEVKRRGQAVSPVYESDYEVGYGLTAKTEAGSILVGSKRFMEAHGVPISRVVARTEKESHAEGRSLVYVARESALLGMIELEPALRPEVVKVLRELRARGIELRLISGDHEAPTRALAESLGFDRYFAGVLSSDKAGMVEDLQREGRTVCFVGDGINDALALRKAAVSIALSDASDIAIHSAQITMLDQGLAFLPDLFALADGFQRKVKTTHGLMTAATAIGTGGVFLAGFRDPVLTALYGVTLAAGAAVSMWPQRTREAAPGEPPRLPPESA